MTRGQIIKAAATLSAADFLGLIEHNQVNFSILDMDNILDPNDGYLNVLVEGLELGEALLFIDGELAG